MEPEASPPGMMSHAANTSGDSPSPYANDFVVDDSVKLGTLEVDGKSGDNDVGSGDRNGTRDGSDDGFVSGEEEFETAPEKLIGGSDDPSVGSLEFSTPKGEEPVLKVPESDVVVVDDDDKGEVLKEELVVGEKDKGLEEEVASGGFVERNGNEDVGSGKEQVLEGGEDNEGKGTEFQGAEQFVDANEVGEMIENSEVVASGNEKADSGDSDAVKFSGKGDAVVDDLIVDLPSSNAAIVGEVEGTGNTDVEELKVSADDSVTLDNSFEKISPEIEQPVAVDAAKPVAELKTEAAEFDSSSGKTNMDHAAKNGNSDVGTVVGDGNENNYREISGAEVSESDTTVTINGNLKVEAAGELEADAETKQIDRATEAGVSGSNIVADDAKVGGDEDITHTSDSIVDSAQTQAVIEVAASEHDQTYEGAAREISEEEISDKFDIPESAELDTVKKPEAELEDKEEEGEDEELITDRANESEIIESSKAAEQFLEELERVSASGPNSGAESSREHSQRIDGQIVTDSDEEADTDEEGEGEELFDSAALAALLKAASGSGSEGGAVTVTSQDGSKLFSLERPAGLGSSLRSVKPAAQPNRPSLFNNFSIPAEGDTDNNLSDEEKKKLENLQLIRVKFLRLVHRLGHSPEESIAAQVLYRMALVAGRQSNQLFSLDAAKQTAVQLETEGKDLNFTLNILVLGKAGVGKSATINSIFGDDKSEIHAFQRATVSVKEISGTVDGVKIRVIDTPGLMPSGSEQNTNRKILSTVKKFMKKCPPDIVLYVDRLDTQTRDLNDLPLLKSITSALGSSIWRNAIVTLTHAASAPPEGPSGSPLSYDVFVAQRSRVVQHSIGQAVGDLRMMSPSLANPVSLVENHRSCRKNRDGQKVLPNGQVWRSQLLLICYSIKILSEASSLSKPQDPFDHKKLFGLRARSPPLPYLLSWLLQSRAHPKLPTDQGADNIDSDIDLDDFSDSDQEEEDEYDQLPPFRPLKPPQLAKLTKEQRKAYFDEYEYRVKLLQKKQWKEELRRMKQMKKGKAAADELGFMGEDVDSDGAPAAVPVPLPDMVLPPSFDSDNPAYRYRFLEPSSLFLARPVLDTHGWDHDCGYDGVNVEQSLGIMNQFPAAVTVQVTKDKKEFNIHLDSSVSMKHGDNGSSMAGFDIQNVGKQLAYILRGETKFKNFKKNKAAAGFSVTFLGENVATGVKVEDQIGLGKRLTLVGSTGTVRSQGDSAYGANLEVRLKDADFPIGQDQSSLGLSLVKWRKDLALGANLQSQFSVGRGSKVAVRAGLNNKMTGQITVRTSSSEQIQIALVGLLPIAMSIYKIIQQGGTESYSMY